MEIDLYLHDKSRIKNIFHRERYARDFVALNHLTNQETPCLFFYRQRFPSNMLANLRCDTFSFFWLVLNTWPLLVSRPMYHDIILFLLIFIMHRIRHNSPLT